jgi:IS5 family transposase
MAGQPRFKDTGGESFFGGYLFDALVPKDHFLRALRALFDWERLGAHLLDLYQGRGLVGRPPYDPIMMFKMLFLGYLYNLSERDTERFVNENIPARFFLDLAFDRPAPDHSSLALYRKRLLKNGNWDSLQKMFDGLLQQARDKGLRLGGIRLVDSVHTQADVNNEKERERQDRGGKPRDPDARVVNKGKRQVVEVDGQRVKKVIRINGYKTHTSGDANKECWLALQQTAHYRAATKIRSRVERPFAQAKDQHGLDRCRYRGLLNYGLQSFLTFMVVNAKRIVKLLTGVTFREQAKGRRKEVYKPVFATLPWA